MQATDFARFATEQLGGDRGVRVGRDSLREQPEAHPSSASNKFGGRRGYGLISSKKQSSRHNINSAAQATCLEYLPVESGVQQ